MTSPASFVAGAAAGALFGAGLVFLLLPRAPKAADPPEPPPVETIAAAPPSPPPAPIGGGADPQFGRDTVQLLSITADGRMYLADRVVDRTTLREQLLLRNTAALKLDVDPAVPYRVIVDAIDTAKLAGVTDVGFLAAGARRPPPSRPLPTDHDDEDDGPHTAP